MEALVGREKMEDIQCQVSIGLKLMNNTLRSPSTNVFLLVESSAGVTNTH